MSLAPINVFDPEQYKRGVPHAKFAALRAQAPVSFQAEAGGRGYWAVTRHADVVFASKHPELFSSSRGGINIPDISEEDMTMARMILINMDPPQHARYRKLVATSFTPKMTARLEAPIRRAVARLLDTLSGQRQRDYVGSIAAQLPLYLIADLIGWPEQDRDKMFDWSNRVARVDYDPEDGRTAAMEFYAYCTDFIASLAEKPAHLKSDDLLHTLRNAHIDGEKLSMMEIVNFALLLAIGGNETTRNCISGGFLALHENPEQLRLLQADPQRHMAGAVEEMLRFTSPITAFRRTATQDTTLGGQAIREGDKVVLYYASANRDEAVFTDPQRFDITRDPNPHLAFGTGQHFCLGATLARMEIGILFTEQLARYPDMVPTGEVTRLGSNYVNGILSFNVRPGRDAKQPPSPAKSEPAHPAP